MRKLRLSILIALPATIICGSKMLAAEAGDWKQTNVSAISAMRSEKYEEAEKLFQQALSQCKTPDDKKTVNANLAILLRKLGKEDDAVRLQGEVVADQKNSDSAQKPSKSTAGPQTAAETSNSELSGKQGIPSPRTVKPSELNDYIKQLDEQIKKADSAGQLETLQNLFKLKADAVRTRDKGESLEYSYVLHFRAQVLHHLKRDAESESLDRYATQVRDHNRMMQQQLQQQSSRANSVYGGGGYGRAGYGRGGYGAGYDPFYSSGPQAPSTTRSTLSNFNTYFDPTPAAKINIPTNDYTTGSSSTYINPEYRNEIDKHTTNIQQTERKFGKF
jgi:tetratricopeptide (TPR) repeat protein